MSSLRQFAKPADKKWGGSTYLDSEGGRYVHLFTARECSWRQFRRATRPTFLLKSNQVEVENTSGAIAC